ncbi:MAG: beta-lactamase protein [Burkholderiaceae bacterium]|nr:beta-lactamase protein [Burkholderiaceae bacterium]
MDEQVPLSIAIVPVTPFAQNCSIVMCNATHDAVVIDAGGDVPTLMKQIREMGAQVRALWLTHGHVDHASGAPELADALQTEYGLDVPMPIIGPHEADQYWIDDLAARARVYGFSGNARSFVPTRYLQDGDVLHIGTETVQVLHCPGHTPGHVVFYHANMRLAWVGDVLFAGSIGRTDFPGGNHADLINAIKSKLLPLGDDVQFISGHGPMSNFGQERRFNPYLV